MIVGDPGANSQDRTKISRAQSQGKFTRRALRPDGDSELWSKISL